MLTPTGRSDPAAGRSLYAAAGVGAILANDTYEGNDNNFTGFGYQLIGGVLVKVADQVALVVELRYQNSFSPLEDDYIQDRRAAALVGVKIGF